MEIHISDLTIDPAVQLRARTLDDDTVQSYVEALENDAKFPPVVAFIDADETLWLADGFHRVAAYRRLGLALIDAEIRNGTRQDAMVYAATANAEHGKPMSRAEKQEAGLRLLQMTDWSQHRIAKELAVTAATVGNWAATIKNFIVDRVVTGQDGRQYNTSNIGPQASDDPAPVSNIWDMQSDDGAEDDDLEDEDACCWNCKNAETDATDEDVIWCHKLGRTIRGGDHDVEQGTCCDMEHWQAQTDDSEETVCAGGDPTQTEAPRPHVANNSGNNEWYTPPIYIEAARRVMGGIDCDPASSELANQTVKAATFYTEEDDGLAQDWRGRVWMNPPYAQPLVAEFCDRLVDQLRAGNTTEACVLVNNATDTTWFHTLLERAGAVCLIRGRVRFLDMQGNPNGAPLQGQAVLYFGPNVGAFAREFSVFGAVLYAKRQDT